MRTKRGSAIRVGSWPGKHFNDNDFIRIFCDSLQEAGIDVVDVVDPRDLSPGDIDVLQIHWPEQVYWRDYGRLKTIRALVETLWAIWRLRRAGVKIAWLVHNLQPHDAPPARLRQWRWYTACIAKLTDALVTLSPATLPIARQNFPFGSDVKCIAIRHPRFSAPQSPPTKEKARQLWEMEAGKVNLAFIGSVRPYKGIVQMAKFIQENGPSTITLTIGGRTDKVCHEELSETINRGGDIRLFPHRLSDEEFESLVIASDFVVLPFQDSLHSSSIVHALSLNRAVLTTRTAYAEEIAKTVGADWVRVFDKPLGKEMFQSLALPASKHPDLSSFAADVNASALSAFYLSLVSPARR